MENTNNSTEKELDGKDTKKDKILSRGDLISFAMDVGFSIALPLAGFLFVGHLLDKNFGTSPIFLIVGLMLSFISTSFIIAKKIKKIL